MDRIKISCDNINELKNKRSFKLAVQFSRLLNIIRANQRQYLRIENNNDPANIRDRIELILYHGAIIYESIKNILGYSKDLNKLEVWSEHETKVKRIQNEYNNKASFTIRYLKPIRNKILFHYEIGIIENMLENYQIPENVTFAESKSEKSIDLAFVLADELLLNYIVQYITEQESEADKWGYFEDQLLKISKDLSDLLYDFILELLGDYIYIEEGNNN